MSVCSVKVQNFIDDSQLKVKLKTSLIELNPFQDSFLIKDLTVSKVDQIISKANLDFAQLSFTFSTHQQNNDLIYVSISNLNSIYLSKQQKQFLLKVYKNASSAYSNSQKLGNVPASRFHYLSSPCITFYLSKNTDIENFVKNHLDFITSTFPILSKKQSINDSILHHASIDNTPKQIDNLELKRLNELLQFAIFEKSKPQVEVSTMQAKISTEVFAPPIFNPFDIDETQDDFTQSSSDLPMTSASIEQMMITSSQQAEAIHTSPLMIPDSILQKSVKQIQESQVSKILTNPFNLSATSPSKLSTQSTLQLSQTIQVLSDQLKTMSQQIEVIDFSSLDGIPKSTDSTSKMFIETVERPDWLW
ncbi:MAG: hypothetical protein KC646_12080 [Candidatus Cloacimonetes bacterium]|nr:hypothetical protein [Candidatus Cloacimonadota bacterium]